MGQSAKNQHVLNYKNTVYGFRNLLGRKFSDPYVKQEMKSFPFEVVAQRNDSIGIKVILYPACAVNYVTSFSRWLMMKVRRSFLQSR
jgi:molecular chaperone DnaK (HSP70)